MYFVNIMEYEAGWGSRLDEQKLFGEDKAAAEAFVKEFNKGNNSPTTPDWYMVAQGPFKDNS
jgi:hypothetical protein